MTNQEVLDIIRDQKAFFASGKTRENDYRKKSLRALRESINIHLKQLQNALHEDLHKSEFEAYVTEIGLALDEISIQLKLIDRMSGWHRVPPSLFTLTSKSRIHYEPYGQTLIVSPWNYPVNLTLIPLIGAVATGNVVVLKTSPDAPHTNRVLRQILEKAFDKRHVAMVEGHREMNAFLFDQQWNHIFLTGSPDLGKVAMAAAAKTLTPVTLELGGKSPCIVDEDADLRIAARRIAFGKCINSGQTCIAPDYLMVHRNVKEAFVEELQSQIRLMYGDNPLQTEHYPHIVSNKAMVRLVPLMNDGHVIFGGRYDLANRCMEPTLIENVREDSPLLNREIFGPIWPLLVYDNIDEVVDYVSSRPKPLAFYYFTNSRRKAKYLISRTTSGGACINDTIMHIANSNLPFGGVQNSGLGRYHGRYSWEAFGHRRSILISSRKLDYWFKYPPFSDFWTRWIKRFMR